MSRRVSCMIELLVGRLSNIITSRIYHMYTMNPVAAQAMFHNAGYTLQMLISTGYVVEHSH